MNGPTVLQTTFAPSKAAVRLATSWVAVTTSWSIVSTPGTWATTSFVRSSSRPTAVNGTCNSRRYSQIRRPV